jgi:hypothetical protein
LWGRWVRFLDGSAFGCPLLSGTSPFWGLAIPALEVPPIFQRDRYTVVALTGNSLNFANAGSLFSCIRHSRAFAGLSLVAVGLNTVFGKRLPRRGYLLYP